MIHHFPFDPCVILGVSASASVDEVREAFREKSKKHHPDLGGDEWAFRMVLRAYEVLKATTNPSLSPGEAPPRSSPTSAAESAPWLRSSPGSAFFSQSRFPFKTEDAGTATVDAEPDLDAEGEAEPETPRERSQSEAPAVFQTVDVELIWIRFEMAATSAGMGAAPAENSEGATLSVCMVVSWPLRSQVSRSAEYANLGETLQHVIASFEAVKDQGALAARSRIEDGQFVGWLGFPDVVAAQAGFLALREGLSAHDLTVHLQTRDEIIPESWAG